MKLNNFEKISVDKIEFDLNKSQYNSKNPIKNHQKILSLKPIPIFILLLSIFLLLSTIAFAIPNSLTLQGKLTNKASVSQQGTFTFMFRIYSVPDFGYYNLTQNITLANGSLAEANITYINYTNILWEQNQSVVTDANGVYDVILKGVNLSFADQYYLGITIGSDNESTPRINLTSSPYSFRANVSEDLNANNSYKVTGLNATGILAANNTLFVNNGLVGIGTITPSYLLQVDSGIDGRSVNLSNVLYVNGSSGRVGIGTTIPNQLLTVIGNVNVSGNLTVGNGNTTLEISTQNLNVSNGNLALSGSIKAGGGLNVTGDTNISGNFYVTGNTVLGSSVTNTIQIVSGVSSDLLPTDNARDIGSATNFWRRAYIDLATINNLSAAGADIGGTTSATFVFNSNYSGNDARDIELIFERGTPVTNAVFKWDSTNKRFDINFPLNIQANNNLTVDTNTLFVDGSSNKVGIGKLNSATELDVAGGINASTLNVSGNAYLATQSGNVGIGTTAPEGKLHVLTASAGTVTAVAEGDDFVVENNADVGISLLSPDANRQYIFFGTPSDNQRAYIKYTGQSYVGADGADKMMFRTNTQDRMVIDSLGNVGIGTTGPGEELEIKSATPELRFNDSDNSNFFDIGMSGTDFKIYSNDTSGSGITISQEGKVGIGTTTPNTKLTVIGGINASGGLNVTSGGITLTSGQLTLPAGTLASPAITWGSGLAGIYNDGANIIALVGNGGDSIRINAAASTIKFPSVGELQWSDGSSLDGDDATIVLDSTVANRGLALRRNGAQPHTLSIFNTFTDTSNYEKFTLDWQTTTNVLRIATTAAGTGTVRNIALMGGNVGINTTAPPQTFQVAGTTNLTTKSTTSFLMTADANVVIHLE